MKKVEFLTKLEENLKKMGVEKVDEILRDYEEYFIEYSQIGKSEQEITESLGDPLEIAMGYINSSTNRDVKHEKEELKLILMNLRGKLIIHTMAFVMILAMIFVGYFCIMQNVYLLIGMLLMDSLLLLIIIPEYKELKKYKDIQKNIKNLTRKDI